MADLLVIQQITLARFQSQMNHSCRSWVDRSVPHLGGQLCHRHSQMCFRFPIYCSILTLVESNATGVANWGCKFRTFSVSAKFRGRIGEMSEPRFPTRHRTQPQIYIWWGAARQFGRLSVQMTAAKQKAFAIRQARRCISN